MGEYAAMFDAEVPRAVQVGLMEMLVQPYQTSAIAGSQYPEGTRKKFQPIQLLADVEMAMRSLGARHRGIVTVEECRTDGNTYDYVRLRCGRVFLTASTVAAPLEVPRSAEFRKSIARVQRDLFGRAEDGMLYAVIAHGHDREDTSRPAFVTVGFPDADYSDEYADHIPLFKRFPSELEASLGIRPEDVNDVGQVIRRRERGTSEGSA